MLPLSIWSNDLWCEGEISDSVITFMASHSPVHSDGGIDHRIRWVVTPEKLGTGFPTAFCLCVPTTFAISEISCAAFGQEAQQ
ncbi:hypothetical protein CEXT_750271 [Caerostris extrusa]|uniref:Uncharacterized protein n=1 Tax=Caerostris extrusa TaxID=172846 RepID=A0AAV4W2Y3_CAEEX|nr:hypothetical protein CEXT_750271 [Caerostris extrusa]